MAEQTQGQQQLLPKAKKQRIFSRSRSERAVKFNAISYYPNTSDNLDDSVFNAPAPPTDQSSSFKSNDYHHHSSGYSSHNNHHHHHHNNNTSSRPQSHLSATSAAPDITTSKYSYSRTRPSEQQSTNNTSSTTSAANKRLLSTTTTTNIHSNSLSSRQHQSSQRNNDLATSNTSSSSSSLFASPSDVKIRKAHQCHESGELKHFDDDIEFYMESLDGKNSVGYRCLSLLGLARLAMSTEFRMHMRAHDDMPRIISVLKDAPNDASLALSCATLMFIYNQDRMTFDIDPQALELMLKLLETRSDEGDCHIEKRYREMVRELCEQMKQKGHAKFLKLDEITAGKLAMETLLGLTSKRAGDWFKEELRRLKGLDFILDTIINALEIEDAAKNESQLNKIERCMHVLENVTFQNKTNQEYIVAYRRGALIDACIELLGTCKYEITVSMDDSSTTTYTQALTSTLRVLNNLTSESGACTAKASRLEELLNKLLYFAIELPSFLKQEQKSDIMMITLCLLINIAEFSTDARERLLNDDNIHELIKIFYNRIRDAQLTEHQADEILDSHQLDRLPEAMQDSVINQVIAKSGKHMEHSIIAACLALLFGCIIQENNEHIARFSSYLTNESFEPLIDVLQKLHNFAHLTIILTSSGVNRVKRILRLFKTQQRSQEGKV